MIGLGSIERKLVCSALSHCQPKANVKPVMARIIAADQRNNAKERSERYERIDEHLLQGLVARNVKNAPA